MPITEYFRTDEGKSRPINRTATVRMYGPAFDGSGELVNREVPERDVRVYEAAGYKRGWLEVPEEAPKPAAPKKAKK